MAKMMALPYEFTRSLSDSSAHALRYPHGNLDPRHLASPAQSAPSDSAEPVCQGGHGAAVLNPPDPTMTRKKPEPDHSKSSLTFTIETYDDPETVEPPSTADSPATGKTKRLLTR